MTDPELQKLRDSIDEVDHDILLALSKRMLLVRDVGAYKRAHNIDTLDRDRFHQLLTDRTAAGAKLSLPASLVQDIFTCIHDESVAEQDRAHL